jgi:hypothetical protein
VVGDFLAPMEKWQPKSFKRARMPAGTKEPATPISAAGSDAVVKRVAR